MLISSSPQSSPSDSNEYRSSHHLEFEAEADETAERAVSEFAASASSHLSGF